MRANSATTERTGEPALAATQSPDISAFVPQIPPPFQHQQFTTQRIVEHPAVFDMSDPGTGKTRSALDAVAQLRAKGYGPALILAPKAILKPSWGKDCDTFTPHLTYSIANATNRAKAFATDADLYITNHDAVKWLVDHPEILAKFDILIVDESTAFKHRASQRSKALASIRQRFKKRVLMSGSATANKLLDIWHQMYLLDDGVRLGFNFFKFQNAVCTAIPTGYRSVVEWHEKEGARETVADLLSDITVRHILEECIDIPEHSVHRMSIALDPVHQETYDELLKDSFSDFGDDAINAVHAAALATKLLQVAAGSVYGASGAALRINDDRYELIMQLIDERPHSVVAFNWKHQRDALVKLATRQNIPHAVIDGEISPSKLAQIVTDFQAGKYRVIFAQPQSASHGLTLTRATTTIWASPTYDAERFLQFNRRIYRAGQKQKTETILIAAENTIDEHVYDILTGKVDGLTALLTLLKTDLKKKETKKHDRKRPTQSRSTRQPDVRASRRET